MSAGHHHHGPEGHTHEHLDHPGHFGEREQPLDRDFSQRAFTVGVKRRAGGSSGKTALMLALCQQIGVKK